jgi:hypothetical protein
MNHLMAGFADELVKVGSIGGLSKRKIIDAVRATIGKAKKSGRHSPSSGGQSMMMEMTGGAGGIKHRAQQASRRANRRWLSQKERGKKLSPRQQAKENALESVWNKEYDKALDG